MKLNPRDKYDVTSSGNSVLERLINELPINIGDERVKIRFNLSFRMLSDCLHDKHNPRTRLIR